MSDITQVIMRYKNSEKDSNSSNTSDYEGKGGIITSCLESFNLKMIPKKMIESLLQNLEEKSEIKKEFFEEGLTQEHMERITESSLNGEMFPKKRLSQFKTYDTIKPRISYICSFRNQVFIYYTCDFVIK
jgi:hypothetical protein